MDLHSIGLGLLILLLLLLSQIISIDAVQGFVNTRQGILERRLGQSSVHSLCASVFVSFLRIGNIVKSFCALSIGRCICICGFRVLLLGLALGSDIIDGWGPLRVLGSCRG